METQQLFCIATVKDCFSIYIKKMVQAKRKLSGYFSKLSPSLISHFSKLFEKLIYKQINKFMEDKFSILWDSEKIIILSICLFKMNMRARERKYIKGIKLEQFSWISEKEAKLSTRYSLLFNRYSLPFNRQSLLFARYLLLFMRYL